MEIQFKHTELSVTSQVSAVEGCLLSGVSLYLFRATNNIEYCTTLVAVWILLLHTSHRKELSNRFVRLSACLPLSVCLLVSTKIAKINLEI